MKTSAELDRALELTFTEWYNRTVEQRKAGARYYLYYQEANSEHGGGLHIAQGKPANPDFKLVENKPIQAYWPLWNIINYYRHAVGPLPLLSR